MKNFQPLCKAITLSFVFILCYTFTSNAQEEHQLRMLELVNNFRAENNLQPVQLNERLNQSAFDHSLDMGTQNYFDHTGLDGSNFSQRAVKSGYEGSPAGENIAAGNFSPDDTFEQWKNSPGHRRNMLNPNHNEMGIGRASVEGSRYRHYWTQVFGRGKLLSIDEFEKEITNIQFYPNPTKDYIQLQMNQPPSRPVAVTAMTMDGKIVYYQQKVTLTNTFTIPLSSMPKGVYFIKVGNNTSQKIVKM